MQTDAMSRSFRSDPAEVPEVRHAVVEYARDHGAIDLDGIAMAVTEAVTNAVVHAYNTPDDGMIEVSAQRHADNGLEVIVVDHGRGIEPRFDGHPGLGLGLPLIASLAEDVELERAANGGTRVRMMFAAR